MILKPSPSPSNMTPIPPFSYPDFNQRYQKVVAEEKKALGESLSFLEKVTKMSSAKKTTHGLFHAKVEALFAELGKIKPKHLQIETQVGLLMIEGRLALRRGKKDSIILGKIQKIVDTLKEIYKGMALQEGFFSAAEQGFQEICPSLKIEKNAPLEELLNRLLLLETPT